MKPYGFKPATGGYPNEHYYRSIHEEYCHDDCSRAFQKKQDKKEIEFQLSIDETNFPYWWEYEYKSYYDELSEYIMDEIKENNIEICNKIKEIAENLKFNVDIEYENGKAIFTFQKYSPRGEDFFFEIETNYSDYDMFDNFITELDNFYEGYDVCYETYLWLDEWGHGKNGAPYDMRDLYNDKEACEKYIEELLDKVREIEI